MRNVCHIILPASSSSAMVGLGYIFSLNDVFSQKARSRFVDIMANTMEKPRLPVLQRARIAYRTVAEVHSLGR